MTALNQDYVSEYGWTITLPPRWEPLEREGKDALVPHRPVVFASPDNWSHSLTWMIATGRPEQEAIEKFVTLTMMPGSVDPTEAQSVVNRIFATMGDVDQANVVELEDGSTALEVAENIDGEPQPKRGYQLLVPVQTAPGTISTFQRLCFYAPEEFFKNAMMEVRKSALSFHYFRPFGLQDT